VGAGVAAMVMTLSMSLFFACFREKMTLFTASGPLLSTVATRKSKFQQRLTKLSNNDDGAAFTPRLRSFFQVSEDGRSYFTDPQLFRSSFSRRMDD
jgi:hypothetical protein